MKNKKVVIASNRGALPEIVQHNSTGFLFSLEMAEELVNILRSLRKDELKNGFKRLQSF